MSNKCYIKTGLMLLVSILFIVSVLTPMVIGYNVRVSNYQTLVENYNIDRYLYPEYYDCYNVDEIPKYIEYQNYEVSKKHRDSSSAETINPIVTTLPLDGPMDSPWPMYCHDTRHTGRSPYSTADNYGDEKWKFETYGGAEGGPVIDKNGTIYIGGYSLYAVYPNGTLKWKFDTIFTIRSAPAIDENGIIYFGIIYGEPNYLYAVSPNGTLKWKYSIGELNSIFSSPVISDDGAIYFGSGGGYPPKGSIWALNPDGSLKWKYDTNHVVYSSPAIGLDGTIYCGSHDEYVYALYPNNGTLRWKFKTGAWVHGSPSIGDDGTVYIGSDDHYLYALYPNNGTMKWKLSVGSMRASPAVGDNGILYFGVWEKVFYAVYPNGTIKWSYNTGERIWDSSAALSADGTIYFGTCDLEYEGGLDIVVLNFNGTLKWRRHIGSLFSSPAIGENGTVYIGASTTTCGYLYTFGKLDPDAPSAPTITGKTSGTVGTEYEYTFRSTSPLGDDVYYYIDWGDNTIKDWFGPYASGEQVKVTHKWSKQGTYVIKARAKDTDNWGPWGELEVTMPRNKVITNNLFFLFLQRFPFLNDCFPFFFN